MSTREEFLQGMRDALSYNEAQHKAAPTPWRAAVIKHLRESIRYHERHIKQEQS